MNEYINSLPPSSVNNSREIVRHMYEKAKKQKYGGYWVEQMKDLGFESDRSGADTGMEQEKLRE